MLTHIWGDTPDHKAIISIKGGVVKHLWPSSPAVGEVVSAKLDQLGHDVYFSVGSFSEQRRKAEFASLNTFYLDIDCGEGKPYHTKKDGIQALVTWCKTNQFYGPSLIVDSGNGLHVYWQLDKYYPREFWLPVAETFKRALVVGDVHADATVTADAARILRVPGTHNHKNPDCPLEVKVIHKIDRKLTLQEFALKLPQVGPRPANYTSSPSMWDIPTEFPPGDAGAIASKCQQMADIRDTRGAVSEPLWRAGLSILQRCADAEHYIKEWSKGDARYNEADALQKAANTKGPYTCKSFAEARPLGCEGCPHAGVVTSPIQLKSSEDSKTRKIGSFILTSRNIFLETAEGGQQIIADVPLWIEEVRVGARTDSNVGKSTLEACWISLSGREQRATVPQRTIQKNDEFVSWLADHNIISAVRDVKMMKWYITEFTRKIELENGTRLFHEVLGWYEGGFVLGDREVSKSGIEPALVQTSSTIKNIKSMGDLEGWKAGVSIFNTPEYNAHAFAVLAGFGSPLLHLANKQSAVVSLVGPSGAGKTLAAHAALSIFANYEELSLGASSTANIVTKQMESCRHVPFLLDEVTQYTTKRLTQFIYDAANGQPKGSLTRDRKERQTYTWKLTPYITSNSPVLENDQAEVQEAHRRRLLEINFNKAMGKEDGAKVDAAIAKNYGVAADVYLQAVCKLQDKIPGLIDREIARLTVEYRIPEANRFGAWTLAAATVGGTIAKALGLIGYDINAVIDFAAQSLAIQAIETQAVEELAEEAVSDWFTENNDRVCFWEEDKRGALVVDNPIARVLGGSIAVHKGQLNRMLKGRNISRRALESWIQSIEVEAPKRYRLGPSSPPVMCYVFDSEKLGFQTESDQ